MNATQRPLKTIPALRVFIEWLGWSTYSVVFFFATACAPVPTPDVEVQSSDQLCHTADSCEADSAGKNCPNWWTAVVVDGGWTCQPDGPIWGARDEDPNQYFQFIADGVVSDSHSKLEWANQTLSWKQLNFGNASAYCDAKTSGGKSDWRLPTRAEILTLVNYARIGQQRSGIGGLSHEGVPALAPPFAAGADAAFWTASRADGAIIAAVFGKKDSGSGASTHWQFWNNAILAVPMDDSVMANVLCVRADFVWSRNSARFTDAEDEVFDTWTSLSWRKKTLGNVSTFSEFAACSSVLNKLSAWRVPTVREFIGLANPVRFRPALDEVFASLPAGAELVQWSRASLSSVTPIDYLPVETVFTAFPIDGMAESTSGSIFVRCVR